jgi:AcrR family transcriptional regulator
MARAIPPDRFTQLIEVATRIFVERGYRPTQMADVAEALGVAKGTLYGYVESKEALFDAAVRFADDPGAAPGPEALPLRSPPAGSTVAFVRQRLLAEARELVLARALGSRRAPRDGAAELAEVVRDLYWRMRRNRRALKLVDRCALDHPELGAVWFEEGRWGQVALLGEYLGRRIAQGRLRAVPSVPFAARALLESIAIWAIHMPWDPSPRPLAEGEIQDALVDLVVHAFAKERRP